MFEPSFILAKERGFIHKVMVESDSQALVHLLNASREALLLVPLHGISNPQRKGNKKKKKKKGRSCLGNLGPKLGFTGIAWYTNIFFKVTGRGAPWTRMKEMPSPPVVMY